ncbi:MAG TPA: NAD-dependent epimerase/dehydratase family protein [Pirellulales bacterium]|jgi:nucleoside-diphosphate-sugar epimerase
MRALVTGGGGFLGRAVVEQLLERGDQVRILARGSYPDLEASGVECQRGDIRELESIDRACAGVDVVFHTAAIAGIWGPWREFYEINVLGTFNVISACRKQGVRRLVFTSSPSVTFDGSPQEGVDESVPYPRRWLCHYQRTKAEAEQAVLKASGAGLLACALRPHLIWGPGDPHLLPRLLDRARTGHLRRVGTGDNLVDTIYVANAARAHIQAADVLKPGSPVAGRAYFISQGEPVNCWEWIDELVALHGLPHVERTISLKAAWRIGAVLETVHRVLAVGREPRMTRFLAAQLGTSHYFDISRARMDFGYVPLVSMADGMRRLRDRTRSRQIAG